MQQRSLVIVLAASLLAGCSTGYQAKNLTGGFSETRLSENSYQVRYVANIITPPDKLPQFLLRRAAELCLEQGKRYFLITGQQDTGRVDTGPFGPTTVPSAQLTFRILDAQDESPDAIDAVIVIEETNAVAEGRLSPKASETFRAFKAQKQSS